MRIARYKDGPSDHVATIVAYHIDGSWDDDPYYPRNGEMEDNDRMQFEIDRLAKLNGELINLLLEKGVITAPEFGGLISYKIEEGDVIK